MGNPGSQQERLIKPVPKGSQAQAALTFYHSSAQLEASTSQMCPKQKPTRGFPPNSLYLQESVCRARRGSQVPLSWFMQNHTASHSPGLDLVPCPSLLSCHLEELNHSNEPIYQHHWLPPATSKHQLPLLSVPLLQPQAGTILSSNQANLSSAVIPCTSHTD